jgi:hypothetical protein
MTVADQVHEGQRKLKIGWMLRTLHDSEGELAEELERVRERHAADAGVHHLALRFRQWSLRHSEELRSQGDRYGAEPGGEDDEWALAGVMRGVRELPGKAAASTPASGAILLRDLRYLHLLAQQVAMDYVIVGTAAQALRDRELMAAVAACQDETERLIAWLNTQVKEAAPQVLTVG